MSVKTEHKDYVIMKPEWEKCLAFATSEKAVHAEGETLLPKLSEQDDTEYEAYKLRSPVLMFTQRAGMAMTGMATRKEAYLTGIEKYQELINQIDADRNDFNSYNSILMLRFLFTGRAATLTDVPQVSNPITLAQAEILGIRPRFIYYTEMDIINWREEKINNVNKLVMVVLRESVTTVDDDDEFTFNPEYRYRVLDIKDNFYRQRLFDDNGDYIPDSETFPKENNVKLGYIPIEIHGGVTPINPPLNAIVDLNLHHYQLGADEMLGLRMAALPTPYVWGIDPNSDDFPVHVGPSKVIGSEDADCSTGFREFSGAGLGSVAVKLQKFEDNIASMSVQMTNDKSGSATGAAIDYANTTSTLSGIVSMLSGELQRSVRMLIKWAGGDPEKVTVTLNQDFMPAGMDANKILALMKAYIGGTITYDTYYRNLAKGEITDPHKASEEELREIEESMPPSLTGGVDEDDTLEVIEG